MKKLAYHRPASLDAALSLKRELGDGARYVAGATDVMVMARAGRFPCQALISLRRLEELKGIRQGETSLTIGAGTTLQEILQSQAVYERVPVLHDAVSVMGSRQMRNMATIGGNVMTAVSSGDTLPPLLVLEAGCLLTGPDGTRRVPMHQMLTGPRATAARPEEVLTALDIPCVGESEPPAAGAFVKMMRRAAMDLAVANLAVQFTLSLDRSRIDKAKVAAGAVGPTALLLDQAGDLMAGQAPGKALLDQAAQAVVDGISPWDDVRGSAWYRREVTGVIFQRAAAQALARLGVEL